MNNELRPYEEYKPSGVEWLGEIPSHWKVSKNSVLFKEVVDTGHDNLELLSILQDKGIVKQSSTGRKIRKSDTNNTYKRIIEGDIGYNLMNAFMGSIGVSRYEGIISPAYAVCRPKFSMNSWYYHYLFRTALYKSEFNKNSYGIMYERNRLYFERFKNIQSIVPPKSEQDQIVKYLDHQLFKINKFIKAKKMLIAVLKEQKQAIINEAVTKGLDPNVKMKTSGVEWMGDMPEHWAVRKISHVSKVILSGLDKKTYPDQKNVRLCNYTDVYKNEYITNEMHFMDATAKDEEIIKLTLKKGDVIITKDSESWQDIAIPAIVNEELKNVLCAYHLAIIRSNNKDIWPHYLYFAFLTKYLSIQYQLRAKGVTRYGLSYQPIRDALIVVPPIEEQKNISEHIYYSTEKINISISKIEKELIYVLEYKNSLISDVVTGKIDVRHIMIDEIEEIELEDLEVGDDSQETDEMIEYEEGEE